MEHYRLRHLDCLSSARRSVRGESEMDDGINRIEAVHADIRRGISLNQDPVAREHGTHKKGTGKTITPRPR